MTFVVAFLLAGLLPGKIATADGVGILLAPADEQLSETEAAYAEALVGALASRDRRAIYLHAKSPTLRAAGVSIPTVSADDDWTPLSSVLDRIAIQLRLDYVLLTSTRRSPDGTPQSSGLLVARGGASTQLTAADADGMTRRVIRAIADLGPPRDPADLPVEIGAEPVAPPIDDAPPATPEPVPAEEEPPAPTPVEEEPVVPVTVVDEPDLSRDVVDREEVEPIDPTLAAAEEAYEGGNLDAASSLLGDYQREHGASGRAHFLRAKLSLARLEHDRALDHLERAVALDPELVEARVWLARLLAERGLWQKSIEQYERSLEGDPTNLEALLGLARVYRDHGHRRRAIRLLREADDAGQSDPSLLMMLGDLYVAEGEVELAERAFLRTASGETGERRAAALERLGDLYVELRRHRDALSCYLEAAELNPSRASMAQRRYREVMAAADGSVHDALTSGWSVFEDFAESGIGQRELVYRHLSEVQAQLDEALRYADGIRPPAALQADHARRQLAYSLAVEATVSALSYLDLGEESMLERATARHGEALAEFRRLQQSSEG